MVCRASCGSLQLTKPEGTCSSECGRKREFRRKVQSQSSYHWHRVDESTDLYVFCRSIAPSDCESLYRALPGFWAVDAYGNRAQLNESHLDLEPKGSSGCPLITIKRPDSVSRAKFVSEGGCDPSSVELYMVEGTSMLGLPDLNSRNSGGEEDVSVKLVGPPQDILAQVGPLCEHYARIPASLSKERSLYRLWV